MSIGTYLNAKRGNPIYQAVAVGIIAMVAMGIAGLSSSGEKEWEDVWVVAITFLLFFALLNTVISLAAENQTAYFWKSITCFLALLGFTLGIAYLVSNVSYYESGIFRWMVVVVGFGYLVFFSIVMAMQRIVNYAQEQDKNLRNEE